MPTLNRLERDFAQPECGRFFRTLGWSFKNPDAAPCNYDKGRPDNFVALRQPNHPVFLVCECKAASSRFDFADLKDEQIKWMLNWQTDHNTPAWFWLMMGDQAVDSKSPFARRTWMMPLNTILALKDEYAEVGIKSLPMNAEAASSRHVTTERKMYATVQLINYQMWYDHRNVILPPIHVFREVYDVEYALLGRRDGAPLDA